MNRARAGTLRNRPELTKHLRSARRFRVRRTWTLGAAVACWGAAMVWSAATGSFGGLLLARLFPGVATAAAGDS